MAKDVFSGSFDSPLVATLFHALYEFDFCREIKHWDDDT